MPKPRILLIAARLKPYFSLVALISSGKCRKTTV